MADPLPLVLSLTLRQKRDPKSKVQSPFKCLHKTTCKSKVGSFFHCLHPPPSPSPLFSVLLSPSTGRPSCPLIYSPGCSTASRPAPCRQSQAEAARICPRTSSSPASCLWTDGTAKKRGKKELVCCLFCKDLTCAAFNKKDQTTAEHRQTSLKWLRL